MKRSSSCLVLALATMFACGGDNPLAKCAGLSDPDGVLAKAHALRLIIYGADVTCENGVPNLTGSETAQSTQAFDRGSALNIDVPAGAHTVVVLAYADTAGLQLIGGACAATKLTADSSQCVGLAIRSLSCTATWGCDKPLVCCNGSCVDTQSDAANCGACVAACTSPQVCALGECAAACPTLLTACNGGCVDTRDDPLHCGGCDTACKVDEVCSAGMCAKQCNTALTKCGQSCVDLATDARNCKFCGTACGTGELCSDGLCACACPTSQATCADLQNDDNNCGTCGHGCAVGQHCSSSLCCPIGTESCNGVCTDVLANADHCGACNVACPASAPVCANKTCFCPPSSPYATCNGVCANLFTATDDCGACGVVCAAGEMCVGATCTSLKTLSVLAGQLGGSGNIDGIGNAARLEVGSGGGMGPQSPAPLALTPDGKIAFVDLSGRTLRYFDPTTTELKTVYQNDDLQSIFAVDSPDSVIYANAAFYRLRLSDGLRTKLAGGGSGDGFGTAASVGDVRRVLLVGTDLYFQEEESLRKLDLTTYYVSTLAGTASLSDSSPIRDDIGTAARFANLSGFAADGAGNLYIGDGCVLRKFTGSSQAVTTIAGHGDCTFPSGNQEGVGTAAQLGPIEDIADDGNGALWLFDGGNAVLWKMDTTSLQLTHFAGNGMPSPYGTDGIGTAATFASSFEGTHIVSIGSSIYAYLPATFSMRRIDTTSAVVTTPVGRSPAAGFADGIGTAAALANPSVITSDGSDRLYISDQGVQAVRAIQLSTGAVTTLGALQPGGTSAPTFSFIGGLAVVGSDLYVADGSSLYSVDRDTHVVTTYLSNGYGQLDGPIATATFSNIFGLAASSHYLYATDRVRIRVVDLTAGTVATFAGSDNPGTGDGIGTAATFTYPDHIAVNGNDLWVHDAARLRHIDLTTRQVDTVFTGKYLSAVAVDPAGHVYVSVNAMVFRLTADNALAPFLGELGATGVSLGPIPATLNQVGGLVYVPNRGLALTDTAENAVLWSPETP